MRVSPSSRRRSAGIVIVRPDGAEWRFLLLRAFRNWDFPKGRIEDGETPLQAALRETAEETGLTDVRFDYGLDWRETAPYSGGKVSRYFLGLSPAGRVHLPVNPQLGRPEHVEFRWCLPAEARRLLPPRLDAVFDWAEATVTGASAPAQPPAPKIDEA